METVKELDEVMADTSEKPVSPQNRDVTGIVKIDVDVTADEAKISLENTAPVDAEPVVEAEAKNPPIKHSSDAQQPKAPKAEVGTVVKEGELTGSALDNIIQAQRKHFLSGITLDTEWRRGQLVYLKQAIKEKAKALREAFAADLNKGEYDFYLTELTPVYNELDFMLKRLSSLTKPKKVRTGFLGLFSRGEIMPEPYGVSLIVSPWNYPFNLTMIPLIGAIAAGNTAIVKPSELTPNVASVIADILKGFDKRHICVIKGGRKECETLFDGKYDFTFFTGGAASARILAEKLSKNLTPSIMELGGKSPCIVAADADIDKAAKRIVWGKFLNAGQTCVAPDFIVVHASIREQFIKRAKHYIDKFYYNKQALTDQFVHIVNDTHAERIMKLLDKHYVICGGIRRGRIIEPTIIDRVLPDDPIMKEEIFGPVMPILVYERVDEIINLLQGMEKPLALYYFGKAQTEYKEIQRRISFGGGCFNDVIMHITEKNLPFGGVGKSGHGSYHGKKTFEAFSHYKSIFYKKRGDTKLRYMPYTANKLKTIKKFFKLDD